MSANSIRHAAILAPNWITFTGTKDNPNVVSVFVKSDQLPNGIQDGIQIVDEQIYNQIATESNYNDSWKLSTLRIQTAAQVILREILEGSVFQKESQLTTACANLFRGSVQIIPFLGNKILSIYDKIRIDYFIHPQLKRSLAEKHEVIGIAFDAKPIFTIPLSALSGEMLADHSYAEVLHAFWLLEKQKRLEENPSISHNSAIDAANSIKQIIQV